MSIAHEDRQTPYHYVKILSAGGWMPRKGSIQSISQPNILGAARYSSAQNNPVALKG